MKRFSLLLSFSFLILQISAQKPVDNTLSPKEKANGFTLLFNGKDLSGWRSPLKQTPPEKGWEVIDGMLHVLDSAAGGKSSDLLTVKQFKCF